MSALVGTTLQHLRSGNFERLQEGCLLAAAFVELASGHPLPADERVRTEPANHDDLVLLHATLAELVSGSPRADGISAAVWAIGKWPDRTTIPVLIRLLVDHRYHDTTATMQALISLNNLGEPTLSLEGRLDVSDRELILRQADEYLRVIGAI